jgi:hypothetical protein
VTATFSKDDVSKIATIIGAQDISFQKDHYRLKVENREERRSISLEIFPETSLGKTRGMLVVVYTGTSHLQLHNCTGYVVSEELGEVTFVAESAGQLSGLVVERGAGCSLYAALNRDLISSDFEQLGVEVMLSGVAMSLAEEILTSDKQKEKDAE